MTASQQETETYLLETERTLSDVLSRAQFLSSLDSSGNMLACDPASAQLVDAAKQTFQSVRRSDLIDVYVHLQECWPVDVPAKDVDALAAQSKSVRSTHRRVQTFVNEMGAACGG